MSVTKNEYHFSNRKLNKLKKKWYHEIDSFITLLDKRLLCHNKESIACELLPNGDLQTAEKRCKLNPSEQLCDDPQNDSTASIPSPPVTTPQIPQTQLIWYWVLTEARLLFKPKGEESIITAINNQIEILNRAIEMHLSYLIIIDGHEDIEETITNHQIIFFVSVARSYHWLWT